MNPDREPTTGPLNFLGSTALAITIIALGFSYEYESYEAEVEFEEPVRSTPAAQTSPSEPKEAALEQKVTAYYESYLAGDEMAAYAMFTEDAQFDLRLEFGGFYEPVEYSFRANESFSEAEELFTGYEVVSSKFEIESVATDADGGVVKASLRQRYRWDGYEGELRASEAFTFKNMFGEPYVVKFQSDQNYQ